MTDTPRRQDQPYVSRRDWRRIGDLLPDHSQCPGCGAWLAKGLADGAGWCGDCLTASRQLPLIDTRDLPDRAHRRNR